MANGASKHRKRWWLRRYGFSRPRTSNPRDDSTSNQHRRQSSDFCWICPRNLSLSWGFEFVPPASMPDLDHRLVATDNHRPPPTFDPALTFDCGGQIFGLEDPTPELVRRPGALLCPRSIFLGERNRRKMDNGCPWFVPRLDADHLGIAVIHVVWNPVIRH